MTDLLRIEQVNDQDVVDSRLIAKELGIEHRALMQTIKKYQERLERKTTLTFEMREFKTTQGNTSTETYCYLNEAQATLLMTFSRNTERVLDCKEKLTNAFIEAKKIIKDGISSLVPKTYKEALLALIAQEEEKERLALDNELKQSIIDDQEKDLLRQSEVIDELFDYSSIIRIAKYNNVHENSFSWRILKMVSDKMELEIKKAPCPRYVTKNLYSHDVWRYAYPNAKLPETTTLTFNN